MTYQYQLRKLLSHTCVSSQHLWIQKFLDESYVHENDYELIYDHDRGLKFTAQVDPK